MNFKLKALTVAAVAAMSLSGVANAIPLNNMFLAAYDTNSKNSFVADLGILASSFSDTTQPFDFSGANWNTFVANSNAATTFYQVLGWDNGNNIYTTSRDSTVSGNSSQFIGATNQFGLGGNFNSFLSADTATTNYVASTASFGKASEIGIDWATNLNNFTTTAQLGQTNSFYKLTKLNNRSGTALTVTPYTGSAWNLSSTGVLNYTSAVAAVPEADTSAMMLAGLGLMGFVARRRRAA